MAVCMTRNLTAAAQALGVSQPALTQAIVKLERQLDVTLFDRSTRPMNLTAYGVALLDYAQRLEQSTDDLTEKLEAMKTGSGGLLRVGAGPTGFTGSCRSRYPNCTATIPACASV